MTKKLIIIVSVIAVIFGISWYIYFPKELEKTSVRLAWLHQTEHAGFYTAVEKKLYAHEGLEVRLEQGGRDIRGIDAVLSGKEDFGVDSADQLLLSRARGNDLVALGVIFRKSPIVLFSKKSSGIKTPYDFVGRTVGRKPGAAQDTAYLVMLQKLGIDRKLIKEVEIRYDLAPFYNDEVDVWNGYVIDEPILAEKAGYPVNIISPDDYGIHTYADVILTKGEMIRTRPDLVEKFLRATLKGWEYAIKHPDEAVDFTLRAEPKLDREHQRKGMDAIIPLVDTGKGYIGWMQPQTWDEIQKILIDYKFLEKPIELDKAYDMSFLKKIYDVRER